MNDIDNHQPISDALLARYAAGTTSTTDLDDIDQWLAKSGRNKAEFERWLLLWASSESHHIDTEAAWQNVKAKTIDKPMILPISTLTWAWRAAASVAIMAGLGWFVMQQRQLSEAPIGANNTAIRVLKGGEWLLPDSSRVYLGKDARVALATNFNQGTRELKLTGEAFFEVKPDAARPFVVHTNSTDVRVLGTSFQVDASTPKTVVSVESGRVEVSRNVHKVLLVKGQSAQAEADTIRRVPIDTAAVSFRTQSFVFDKTKLKEVVAALCNGYRQDIRIENAKLSDCQLTARFERENLNTTLSIIAQTLNLSVRKKGRTIVLAGVGCQ